MLDWETLRKLIFQQTVFPNMFNDVQVCMSPKAVLHKANLIHLSTTQICFGSLCHTT